MNEDKKIGLHNLHREESARGLESQLKRIKEKQERSEDKPRLIPLTDSEIKQEIEWLSDYNAYIYFNTKVDNDRALPKVDKINERIDFLKKCLRGKEGFDQEEIKATADDLKALGEMCNQLCSGLKERYEKLKKYTE